MHDIAATGRRRLVAVLGAAAVGMATLLPTAAPVQAASPGLHGGPPAHESDLFASTYGSLLDRVTGRGYAPTSLTGYYGAMYTRDSSVNALALLLGGDDDKARAILRYIVRYSAASGAARMPHRIYQESDTLAPSGQQTDTSAAAVDLGRQHEAVQPMPAPGLVTATDVWLGRTDAARGSIDATLLAGTGPDATVVDSTKVSVDQIPDGGGWVRLRFLPPLFDTPPADGYTLRLHAQDTPPGSVTWRGAPDGTLSYRERVTDFHISGYDMFDETDQAYSVLLVWARYVAANPQDGAFVDETWPYVRRYANYYLDTPGYLNANLDLIRNPILDDEGYHNTYDLLTNVFTSQALHELAPIAARLDDGADAARWQAVAQQIEHGIDTNLVTTVDGAPIYAEKYEVNQGNRFYAGYSFANLSPIAVDWYALDTRTLAHTMHAYLTHESRDWSGVQMLSSMHDYAFTGHNDWVLTKGLAWEWRFAQQAGDQGRLAELDRFLRTYYPDTSQPISEGWILDSTGALRVTDPGNQEHAAWYAVELLETYPGLQGVAHAVSTALHHAPTLRANSPTTADPGIGFSVTATLRNSTHRPVDYGTASLAVPAGWRADTTATGGQLAPGDPVTFTWTVTAPIDAVGPAQLTASVPTGPRTGAATSVTSTTSVRAVPPAADLAAAANNIGITDDTAPAPGNFDGGNSFSAQALAAAGLTTGTTIDHGGLQFSWPSQPAGAADNVAGHVVIRLHGSGSTIGFLGAAVHKQSGTATVVYTDGSTQAVRIAFPNYAGTVPLDGAENIATCAYRNTPSGPANFGVGYHIYYWSAPIRPDKAVALISMPDNPSLHIFAMSITPS